MMAKILFGMGLQALITGLMTKYGYLEPIASQQILAGLLFWGLALFSLAIKPYKNRGDK